MPFRSLSTLESWLEEFAELGYPSAGTLKVIQQDGLDGANTGLVAIELVHASTVTYIQPEADGSLEWVVTMEPRDDAVTLDADSLRALAAELTVVAELCSFLQAKSRAFVGQDAI
jgi:hypothetical protein